MPELEREYTSKALQAVSAHLSKLPPDVQRSVKLALSVIATHGGPTSEEMRRVLGSNWVLARRTRRIVAQYGDDVKCYSAKQYEAAEREAIESREALVEQGYVRK